MIYTELLAHAFVNDLEKYAKQRDEEVNNIKKERDNLKKSNNGLKTQNFILSKCNLKLKNKNNDVNAHNMILQIKNIHLRNEIQGLKKKIERIQK
ncbi:hypothetical protein CWO85_01735 [Candidatus Phytoplasma ziziphi]|uniref:Uncharacterized protein n=1 Tax=Ziziphus jujuba witches'-broom phytoplasma TaxID=135727 RepID=A0A660HMJ2_ZIZJU|nr:hypothetical protein [Candidatus Phytoplasma ziziphi]AYJ01244.1 hypothetical protein CWO85_01735 [Candidatus Phytoplasma ziziphi]